MRDGTGPEVMAGIGPARDDGPGYLNGERSSKALSGPTVRINLRGSFAPGAEAGIV